MVLKLDICLEQHRFKKKTLAEQSTLPCTRVSRTWHEVLKHVRKTPDCATTTIILNSATSKIRMGARGHRSIQSILQHDVIHVDVRCDIGS